MLMGRPDLAVAITHASAAMASIRIKVSLGNGDGTFQAGRAFAAGSGPNGIVAGDFNVDGSLWTRGGGLSATQPPAPKQQTLASALGWKR